MDQEPTDANLSNSELAELCILLPKVELHCHLTGALPNHAVEEILKDEDPEIAADAHLVTPVVPDKSPGAQAAAWELLKKQCNAVAVACRQPGNLRKLVGDAIDQLARDGVHYCG